MSNPIAPILGATVKRSVSLDADLLDRLTDGERENLSATIRAALRLMLDARNADPLPFTDDEMAALAAAVHESGYEASPKLFRLMHLPARPELTRKLHALRPVQAYTLADRLLG